MNGKQPQPDTTIRRIPALGIDEGVWIIDGLGRGNRRRRRCSGRVDAAPNKPNLWRFWAKNAGRQKNKANLAGAVGTRQIRNPKLKTQNKPKIQNDANSAGEACGQNAKQSQFAPVLGQKRGWTWKTKPIWPGESGTRGRQAA
jgi:hypothetical protein